MENCTCAPLSWLQAVGEDIGVPQGGVIAILTTFASIGLLSFLAIAPYCFRLCRGHDVVTECRLGQSVVTLSIDSTGNGLHAAQKLVFDMNARNVALHPTGGAGSPADGLAPPVRSELASSPKKSRRILSSSVINPLSSGTTLPPTP